MHMSDNPLSKSPLLHVEHLAVNFGRGAQAQTVVRDVAFTLEKGETLALLTPLCNCCHTPTPGTR
jgi:ABC-type glutathione transport system ATPase component